MSFKAHKLSGSVAGALAGGGDPATSPLYVFGPFLRLIFAAGLASVVFGAALWMAVLTVVMVSGVYRMVMGWVTDGTGGSGLNEEEFGAWAVMVNAAITVVEYTLTFLVSIAALVTFLVDRFPALDRGLWGVSAGTGVAIGVSLLIGFAVNLGPKVATRAFGPATAAVLLLLWVMIGATIWRYGLVLPSFDLAAFSAANIGVTLGAYARILALMTGIEIFANLVAAYEGPAKVRARKAFGSLVIVMGTTTMTMLIVGPAIFDLSDPSNHDVSVFTQTMDRLLPAPLPYVGTFVGVAVLASAAAASAQGIQNLSVGLRYRHYIPPWLGERNRHDVAANPVWLEVGVCIACFLALGTDEETYLALYAAGVFILLSLTGWAAVKRLVRELGRQPSMGRVAGIGVTVLAAALTSGATVVIFEERFTEGAWIYVVILPVLFVVFRHFKKRLGVPHPIDLRLGQAIGSSYLPPNFSDALYAGVSYANILVPLDRSPRSEVALSLAKTMARTYLGTVRLLTVVDDDDPTREARAHLDDVAEDLAAADCRWTISVRRGNPAEVIGEAAVASDTDLVILSFHAQSRLSRWILSQLTTKVIHQTTPPLLLLRPTDDWRSIRTRFRRVLVTLDGSETAEQVLPHVHELGVRFGGEVTLLTVAEGSQEDDHDERLMHYLSRIAERLATKGVVAVTRLEKSAPTRAILQVCRQEQIDLVMMVSHGRGGLERQESIKLGSVVGNVIQHAPCPVFLVSGRQPAHGAAQVPR